MSRKKRESAESIRRTNAAEGARESRRQEVLLNTGDLQNAIFNSANFSSIATDAMGVIQIFNPGAERMLGYAAAEVTNKITPADISDPQEVIARAKALSVELCTPITPGFEAIVFKASRGIEDIYELTYIRKDGTRFPAIVSTPLREGRQRARRAAPAPPPLDRGEANFEHLGGTVQADEFGSLDGTRAEFHGVRCRHGRSASNAENVNTN